MTTMMIRAGLLLALALPGAMHPAAASDTAVEAPRISVGSVMTPETRQDTVPTTLEPQAAPTY